MVTDELAPVTEGAPILIEREQPDLVQTPYIKSIVRRALLYIAAGYPVHFRGPTGTGKTTLAMYVAAQLGRPVMLLHGDERFGTSDLVGGEHGYRMKKMVDNFIHSVLKTEEYVQKKWVDSRITVACRHGFTLLYDEFTRSRPEANNVLLSVLGERILYLPVARTENGHLRVHPDFSAIFTSNPEEYVGVHKAQNALIDRMITIDLGYYDRETEIAITQAKSGVPRPDAEKIVNIVRDLRKVREYESTPTVRACIMMGKVLKLCGGHVSAKDEDFTQACLDILGSEASGTGIIGVADNGKSRVTEPVLALIRKHR